MKVAKAVIIPVLFGASALGVGIASNVLAQSSSNPPQKVLVVCGPNGAARIEDSDKVPPGCHVSTVNSPPAGS